MTSNNSKVQLWHHRSISTSQKSDSSSKGDLSSTSSNDKDVDSGIEGDNEDWDAWIPPEHALAGDRGDSHEYATDPDKQEGNSLVVADASDVDWLKTRRSRISERTSAGYRIPIVDYTLLTRDEIVSLLEYFSARDIVVVLDNPERRRLGGATGVVVATLDHSTQRWQAAQTLCRHMKLRKLDERDVVGAQLGPEGTPQDDWVVVDAHNYVIHLQDEETREHVKLEKLWSGEDAMWSLDLSDEEAVDRYVDNNPVPAGYGVSNVDWDAKLKELQRTRFTAARKGQDRPKRPVSRRRVNRRR
jgi:ribosomal silencing factor RsfS